jgi:prepilin-type N-terminal cleavage/methylation domain-containing protein/prepilin-type processing-associated H-X9-DG protein
MKRKVGFTLIELLVVIAVIAVLMGILMPALQKAKSLGQNAKCKGNLKSYCLATHMYTMENDGRLVDPWKTYFSQRGAYPEEAGLNRHRQLRWCNGEVSLREHPEYAASFFGYLVDARALICPAFVVLAKATSQDQHFMAAGGGVGHYKPWYNYTPNAYLGPPDASLQGIRVSNINRVMHPTETYSFTEESCFVDTDYNVSGLNDTYMIPGNREMVKGWLTQSRFNYRDVKPGPKTLDPTNDGAFYDVIAGFHNAPSGDKLGGRGNCAFIDGHVDAHPRSETFALAWPRGKIDGPLP